MDIQFWAIIWVGIVVVVLGVFLYYVIKSYQIVDDSQSEESEETQPKEQ